MLISNPEQLTVKTPIHIWHKNWILATMLEPCSEVGETKYMLLKKDSPHADGDVMDWRIHNAKDSMWTNFAMLKSEGKIGWDKEPPKQLNLFEL